MNSIDISPLIKGILVVIGIAIATCHYGDLQTWARREAVEALVWRQPLPYFFAPVHHQGIAKSDSNRAEASPLDKQVAMPRNPPNAAKRPSNFNIAIVRTSAL